MKEWHRPGKACERNKGRCPADSASGGDDGLSAVEPPAVRGERAKRVQYVGRVESQPFRDTRTLQGRDRDPVACQQLGEPSTETALGVVEDDLSRRDVR
jgi:hypothetical protein